MNSVQVDKPKNKQRWEFESISFHLYRYNINTDYIVSGKLAISNNKVNNNCILFEQVHFWYSVYDLFKITCILSVFISYMYIINK